MIFTHYPDLRDPSGQQQTVATFEHFASWLRAQSCEGDKTDAPLWAAHEFHDGAPRVHEIENIARLHAVALDFDALPAQDWDRVVSALHGREYLDHNTHSHDPGSGKVHARVVLSVSQPIEVAKWPEELERILKKLGLRDLESYRASRVFFVPPADQKLRYHPGIPIELSGIRSFSSVRVSESGRRD